jgi:Holliday junction resolvasome RuvABC endonuclease subunit
MKMARKHGVVLAIYSNARGFGYVLLESPLSLVDWGVADIRSKEKNRECLRRIAKLFGQYDPCAVVLPDVLSPGAKRAGRVRQLNEAIVVLADTQAIPVFAYAKASVRECFSIGDVRNKYLIAEAIAKRLPELARFIPPPRKPWKSEDCRMALFDAAALGLTFFHKSNGAGEQM